MGWPRSNHLNLTVPRPALNLLVGESLAQPQEGVATPRSMLTGEPDPVDFPQVEMELRDEIPNRNRRNRRNRVGPRLHTRAGTCGAVA